MMIRNKNCCHPFVAGDVFRFMSILIKLSNHLGLILPGAHAVVIDRDVSNCDGIGPTDTPEQVILRTCQLNKSTLMHSLS